MMKISSEVIIDQSMKIAVAVVDALKLETETN